MPAWVREAARPGPVRVLDTVLEVCAAFPAYTVSDVLDLPTRQFLAIVDYLRRRNAQRAQAATADPLGALALHDER